MCNDASGDVAKTVGDKHVSAGGDPAGLDITSVKVKVTADQLRLDVTLAKPFASGVYLTPGTFATLEAVLFRPGAEKNPNTHVVYKAEATRGKAINATTTKTALVFQAESLTKDRYTTTPVPGSHIRLDNQGLHVTAPLDALPHLPPTFEFTAQTAAHDLRGIGTWWNDGCPATAQAGKYLTNTPLPRYPQRPGDPGLTPATTASTTSVPQTTSTEAATTTRATPTTQPASAGQTPLDAARAAAVVYYTVGTPAAGYPPASDVIAPTARASSSDETLGALYASADCTQIVSAIEPQDPEAAASPSASYIEFDLTFALRCPGGAPTDPTTGSPAPLTIPDVAGVEVDPKPGGGYWATDIYLVDQD